MTRLAEASGAALVLALVEALAGSWHNAPQYDAAPATLKVAPTAAGDWLDLQHAAFKRIDAPAIGPQVLYLEWRSGGAGGAVSRQRIWSFRTDAQGAVRMDFYAFVDGKPWVGRAEEVGAFSVLSPTQLRGYGDAGALRFVATDERSSRGAITSDQCSLVAASGRRMGIDAVVELQADGSLRYQESGRLDDGRSAFWVPPAKPYR